MNQNSKAICALTVSLILMTCIYVWANRYDFIEHPDAVEIDGKRLTVLTKVNTITGYECTVHAGVPFEWVSQGSRLKNPIWFWTKGTGFPTFCSDDVTDLYD